jgi:hypothetical protein
MMPPGIGTEVVF